MVLATVLMVFMLLCSSSYASIIINEVYYKTESGNTLGQWIELYNTSATESINLGTTSLRLEMSGSTSWTAGGSKSLDIVSSHIIGPQEYFLISNVSTDLGNNIFADYVSSLNWLLPTPTTSTYSTRGIRLKLDGVIQDAILYGKVDGTSTNNGNLDPSGYYAGGGLIGNVPIVAGTSNGYSLGRENFVDNNLPSDWHIFATSTPQNGAEPIPEPCTMAVFLFGMVYLRFKVKK